MAETFRSDGKAVDVTVNAIITKGDAVSQDGFQGIAMQDAVSGEVIALEIALREHELNVGAIAAAKGAVIYMTTASGALTATGGAGKVAFAKVTVAKDANNIVWAVLLPQSV